MAGRHMFHSNEQLDDLFFHSIPTSFFVQDERIPKILRELIFEAEGCLKMNFLTGASVCARKAIYEFTIIEQAQGENYDERIKFLKVKFSDVDSRYFDVLCHIKDMTSDKVHEQSWDKWDTKHIQLLLEVMRSIFNDIYVAPKEKEERSKAVTTLLEGVRKGKQASPNTGNQAQRTR